MSEQNGSTAVAVTDTAVQNIRQKGAHAVALLKEHRSVDKLVENSEWGSGNQLVRGSQMSPGARQALTTFCVTVGAHPQLHVALFAGKPWLNADYWSDRLNTEPSFISYEQINITHDEERCAHYGVPDGAIAAYETVIRKLVSFAPIEKIRSGELTDWQQYVVEVREANWAGGKKGGRPDPIGEQEPSKTARTRSLRRCGARAFPAWMQKDEQIQRAEEILEAEFEVVQNDRQQLARQIPAGADDQVLRTGGGEAQGVSGRQVAEQDEQQQSAEFDRTKAQRGLFATLHDAGISDAERKPWAKRNNLPESTKLWEVADFERAMEILIAPTRTKLEEGCALLGVSVDALALEVFGHPATMLKELKQLVGECNQRLDAVAESGEDL